MTDLPDPGLEPDLDPDVVAERRAEQAAEDEQAWREHDELGTDLASQIAHRVAAGGAVNLPPSRGIRKRRRRADPVNLRSGSHPDDRDPQEVGALLGHLVKQRGWGKQLSVRTLLTSWPALVGEVNAAHSAPEGYDAGVLTVRAESSTWATSLRSIAPQLVAELNRRLGDGTVVRITVVGPSAPSWKHGPRAVRDGRGPRDTYG
ncbi:DUF721 domain-containing protein [Aestuariimicrobium sp. T2.26MG-19.2B]|uniref:DUF721 domain-containing protein n=1 Tax=Aestuariimicrobium sp. T2.26MG-19.2B TaxID=3040679 RepID=UPI002477B322|nr:DciA family protein [Aestuariimicrobium sp. T2.26MG-19.2B]CAI9403627.1 hypothetical protein AESSP_01043 [Aestuariimicrobium sp. T2.26MG-19.2B]